MGVAAKAQPILRAALYARFSSDIQKDRSIEDQFTELERAVKRLGFKIDKRHYYADRGVSATSLFERPGLTRDLLGAAQRGEIDVVLVEATDRLARSRADTFWLADRFKFHNVKLFTPAGEVSDLQLTFEGHSNEDFIKKLSIRVKRGHNALTREGRFAGGRCYGYDQTPALASVRSTKSRRTSCAASSPSTPAASRPAGFAPGWSAIAFCLQPARRFGTTKVSLVVTARGQVKVYFTANSTAARSFVTVSSRSRILTPASTSTAREISTT